MSVSLLQSNSAINVNWPGHSVVVFLLHIKPTVNVGVRKLFGFACRRTYVHLCSYVEWLKINSIISLIGTRFVTMVARKWQKSLFAWWIPAIFLFSNLIIFEVWPEWHHDRPDQSGGKDLKTATVAVPCCTSNSSGWAVGWQRTGRNCMTYRHTEAGISGNSSLSNM